PSTTSSCGSSRNSARPPPTEAARPSAPSANATSRNGPGPSRDRVTNWAWPVALEPAGLLEPAPQHEADTEHQGQHERVPGGPAELGHVVEVHAVDPGDQRVGTADRDPRRDLAHVLVLLDAGLGEA